MPIKKSVSLSDESVEICRIISRAHAIDSIQWSNALNTITDEYELVMTENIPQLTKNQWYALYCVYNGHMPHPSAEYEARSLAWRVNEGYQYDSQVNDYLGPKEDAIAFIEEIEGWSLTMKLSAIYHSKKFWAGDAL